MEREPRDKPSGGRRVSFDAFGKRALPDVEQVDRLRLEHFEFAQRGFAPSWPGGGFDVEGCDTTPFCSYVPPEASGTDLASNRARREALQAYLDCRAGRIAWIPAGQHRINGPLYIDYPIKIVLEPSARIDLVPEPFVVAVEDFFDITLETGQSGKAFPAIVVRHAGVTIEGGSITVPTEAGVNWWDQRRATSGHARGVPSVPQIPQRAAHDNTLELDDLVTVGIQVLAPNFELHRTNVLRFALGVHVYGQGGNHASDGRWMPGSIEDCAVGMLFDYALDDQRVADGYVTNHVLIGARFHTRHVPDEVLAPPGGAAEPSDQPVLCIVVAGAQTSSIVFIACSFEAEAKVIGSSDDHPGWVAKLYGAGTHFHACRFENTVKIYLEGPPDPTTAEQMWDGDELVQVDTKGSRTNAFIYPWRTSSPLLFDNKSEAWDQVFWGNSRLVMRGITMRKKLGQFPTGEPELFGGLPDGEG